MIKQRLNKKKLPKKWYFDGKLYNLIWRKPRNLEGLCQDPNAPSKERFIQVNINTDIQEVVNTIIHESTHAHLWHLSEETVTNFSDNITKLLFSCFDITPKK